MRRLPTYLHVLMTVLLLGGYGAMYAGSITHDLGHMVEESKLAGDKDCDHHESYGETDHEKHLEVSCFFCSHAPVISEDLVVDQIWTPGVASLAPPFERSSSLTYRPIELPALRGPPTA